MAYYSSTYSEDEAGEYQWTPYSCSYDVVPFHDAPYCSDFKLNEPKSIEYNSEKYDIWYEHSKIMYSAPNLAEPRLLNYYPNNNDYCYDHDFAEPKLLDYYPNNYGGDSCDPFYANKYGINYSVYNYGEPDVVEYNPTVYQTQYYISYNIKEFNEPAYEEYDSTPYDGGYDQALTYGKPLPPSDQICYPRSSPEPNDLPLSGFSYNSTPSPYGNDDSLVKPIEEIKANGDNNNTQIVPIEEIKANGENNSTQVEEIEQLKENGEIQETRPSGDEELAIVERFDANYGEEIEGYNNGHDYPWLDYDYGYGNGRFGGYEYEYGKKIVAQTQHGYGLDGMDYCESIFGYWPCLAKQIKKRNGVIQESSSKGSESELCRRVAESIFGSSLGATNSVNGYDSFYRQQSGYGQEGYYS